MARALAQVPATVPAEHKQVLQSWADVIRSGEIKKQNETSYDSVFIQQIMIGVLGYKDFSPGGYCTLKKNLPVGGGNVDIALGKFSKSETVITAPFELKGAKTWNLDAIMPGRHKSPVQQAWEYAMDAPGARWVLVSNYLEIRLYAVGYGRANYESFDLSTLTDPVVYRRFMLLLSAENLLGTYTLELLEASEQVGKEITNKLYDDYRRLREMLITSLKANNPNVSELNIISYAQTLLDRILFVAFAQNRELLPKETLKKTCETQNPYHPVPIWENFKGLFRAIDKGSPPLNIPGYNGGLFAYDEGIDSLQLSDTICKEFKKLGDYDFESDVSVNILGHIFEQSVTDLEEIKARATGDIKNLGEKTSKRKKDGIFYTPPYITRYIVEQAVGSWLNARKEEIGFDGLPELTDADYATIQINKRSGTVAYNKKIALHVKAWEAYQESLSNIKVLDPACGSGAFLNEVFDYLYREGQLVNNQLNVFNAGQEKLFRWETHILANNIYGVDINHESVEITKLSLWLKTANRSERLTYLEDNIKCGNSLIDDPAIAGSLAFKWEDEFSEIISAGGFDVVIGNPPYGGIELISWDYRRWYETNYKTASGRFDLYSLFIEKGSQLHKKNGYLGYIIPNKYLWNVQFSKSRAFLLEASSIDVASIGEKVFSDAQVESIIIVCKPANHTKTYSYKKLNGSIETKHFCVEASSIMLGDQYTFLTNFSDSDAILEKLDRASYRLSDIADLKDGIVAGKIKDILFIDFPIDEDSKPLLFGKDIDRFFTGKAAKYVNYKPNQMMDEEIKRQQGKRPGLWLREQRIFEREKILTRFVASKIIATIDNCNNYYSHTLHSISIKSENFANLYVLCLLNSKLYEYYYRAKNTESGKLFPQVRIAFLKTLPIFEADIDTQKEFIKKAEIMLAKNNELHKQSDKFIALLRSEFGLEKLSGNLEQWYTLDFSAFMAELVKKKITLSLAQKTEWMEYFNQQKAAANALKATIDATDREIDQMAYTLYGLTSDEIAIIERQSIPQLSEQPV